MAKDSEMAVASVSTLFKPVRTQVRIFGMVFPSL
jgi:hypothetical protein